MPVPARAAARRTARRPRTPHRHRPPRGGGLHRVHRFSRQPQHRRQLCVVLLHSGGILFRRCQLSTNWTYCRSFPTCPAHRFHHRAPNALHAPAPSDTINLLRAEVVKLADTRCSGRRERKLVWVRVPPSAPIFRRDGGTGRRIRLRGVWGNPWGFESPSRHHFSMHLGAFGVGVNRDIPSTTVLAPTSHRHPGACPLCIGCSWVRSPRRTQDRRIPGVALGGGGCVLGADVERHLPEVVQICRQELIESLSVFGSATRDDFAPHSDIDLIARFAPTHRVGLLRLLAVQRRFSQSFEGRAVDLHTWREIHPLIRDRVQEQLIPVFPPEGPRGR